MQSKGYARGIDFRLFGEFVPGTESWASLSILQTEEDITGDAYYLRYNAAGEQIIAGYTFDQNAVDSQKLNRATFRGRLINASISVSSSRITCPSRRPSRCHSTCSSALHSPSALPDVIVTKTFTVHPSYRRVDLGLSKQIIGEDVVNKPQGKFFSGFKSLWIGVEVFNLLQVSNVASYSWITDVSNARKYAVPNYLTARQLNLRINARF